MGTASGQEVIFTILCYNMPIMSLENCYPEASGGVGLRQIASVTLQHISGEPLPHEGEGLRDATAQMERWLTFAEVGMQERGLSSQPVDEFFDSRAASFTVSGEGDKAQLKHRFYLTGPLLQALREAYAAKGLPLTQSEIAAISLENSGEAVTPGFRSDAHNLVNASFYASPIAFEHEARPASFLADNKPVNHILGAMIADKAGVAGRHVRIKELSCGADVGHWEYATRGALGRGACGIDLTLTDFVMPRLDTVLQTPQLQLRVEEYSLLDDLSPLPDEERFDGIIGKYSLDSVWHPEDMRIVWVGDQAYQEAYRLKVLDTHPRADELRAALKDGVPLQNAAACDYDAIFTEIALEPVDLAAHPYGQYIARLRGKNVSQSFPGGLIKRVAEAFDNQLTPEGAFVAVDVADFGWAEIKFDVPLPSWCVSGAAGRYKIENYWLAKQILEEVHGLSVDLMSFAQLSMNYLTPEEEAAYSRSDISQLYDTPTTGVLIARRAEVVLQNKLRVVQALGVSTCARSRSTGS
jgi:hypothetical protein